MVTNNNTDIVYKTIFTNNLTYKIHTDIIIGHGGFSSVCIGNTVGNDTLYAIKIVDAQINGNGSQKDVSRIKNEISILQLLNINNEANNTASKVNKHNESIVKLIDFISDINYKSFYCNYCSCLDFTYNSALSERSLTNNNDNSNDKNDICKNCSHPRYAHCTYLSVKKVVLLVEELGLFGDMFNLINSNTEINNDNSSFSNALYTDRTNNINSKGFPPEIAAHYYRQLIEGIEFCHKNGIVHRDLKLENLVIDKDFNLKIIDFGLACFIDNNLNEFSSQSFKGSHLYSAPEVIYNSEMYSNKRFSGEAADIWSSGVILFIMLCGRPPFRRPIHRTYSPALRKCKYFVDLIAGEGYPDSIPDAAKDLLRRIFVLDPNNRTSIRDIKDSNFFRFESPSKTLLQREIYKRAVSYYKSQKKIDFLSMINSNLSNITSDFRQMNLTPQQLHGEDQIPLIETYNHYNNVGAHVEKDNENCDEKSRESTRIVQQYLL